MRALGRTRPKNVTREAGCIIAADCEQSVAVDVIGRAVHQVDRNDLEGHDVAAEDQRSEADAVAEDQRVEAAGAACEERIRAANRGGLVAAHPDHGQKQAVAAIDPWC